VSRLRGGKVSGCVPSFLDVLEVVSAELYWSMDDGFIQQVIPMSRISTSICGEIPTLNFLLIKSKKILKY
jgi:hypothetical protein